MSPIFRVLPVVLCAGLLFACAKKPGEEKSAAGLETDTQKYSYAQGVGLGKNIKPIEKHIDIAALKAGIDDGLKGEVKLDEATINEVGERVSKQIREAITKEREEQATKKKDEAAKFFEENGKKPNVKTTASGLQYEVVTEGTGASPTATDTVTAHYKGSKLDGEVFDSSYERKEPITIPANQVIPGWTEGLQLMKEGAKYKFWIPPQLGYGEAGAGAKIGPNEVLVFEVELLKVEKAK